MQRNVLFVPSTLVAMTLGVGWSIAGGLVSCDSTAKFNIQDRKFTAVQTVTTFPIHIAPNGNISRVCGAPLDGSAPLAVNGLQFAVNMIGTKVLKSSCESDLDQSVKEGERIEQLVVTTKAAQRTVAVNNWKLQLDCVGTRDGSTSGCNGIDPPDQTAHSVRYVSTAPRCVEGDPTTVQRVAIVMDHSGSTSGQVTPVDFGQGEVGIEEPPDEVVLGPNFKDFVSDPFNARIEAARLLIDRLTSNDRVISYYFDETKVAVACSSARACDGGAKAGQACNTNSDCTSNGESYNCADQLADNLTDKNKYQQMSQDEQEQNCFGAKTAPKADNKTGLALNARLGGEGRAPVWAALEEAYDFFRFRNGSGSGQEHIVLFTDGPDTCTPDEDFNWRELDANSPATSKCRTSCIQFNSAFKSLVERMNQDQFPIRIHVVQFQSSGYKQPDPRLYDLACLSGGTYQFINTEQFPKAKSDNFLNTLNEAAFRVRSALSGQWLVNFELPGLANSSASDPAPLGKMIAVKGQLTFENPDFKSLASAYDPTSPSKPHQFIVNGDVDGRLMFRKACRDSSECGGSDPCGAMRCNSKGLCEPDPAKDRMPCQDNKMCCGGICSTTCAGNQGCEVP